MQIPLIAVTLLGYSVVQTIAFPQLSPQAIHNLVKKDSTSEGCPFAQQKAEKHAKRKAGFNAKAQYVSTTGKHAFKAPTASDKRGPCPGLNALANHGYLPHNGIAPMTTIIRAVNEAYNMAIDFGTFLALYGTVFDGDILSSTPGYSIGGPASTGVLSGLLSGVGVLRTPSGLSGSHNNYEGDTSAARGDLYSTGNNDLLQIPLFQRYYDALLPDTPAPQQYSALFPFRKSRFDDSINTNPYFFFPPFAGVLVAPAGYAFPPSMMANHSDQYPEGYLDKQTFKNFFAVSGEPGKFTYQPGHERIPENWYKRATPYRAEDFLLQVLEFGIQDPRLLSVGGNTGTTNSFTGVSVSDLTGGVFNAATLAEGNNLQCFVFQAIQTEAPGQLTGLYEDLAKALQPLVKDIKKNLKGLNCPQLMAVDESLYEQYPGYKKSGWAM